MKMKGIVLLLLTCLIPGYTLNGQTSVKGIVYLDSNGNNKKDRNEKGIPQVQVSNGREVVSTGQKGEYSLPVNNDDIIFVIKPSAYRFPLNEFNQPRFYYNNKPNGSPALKYKGVQPSGKIPASVDFPLFADDTPDTFKILVFGDPQPYTEKEVDYFYRGIVSEIEGNKEVKFGITLGDLVGDNLDLHLPYKNAIKKVGVPWYNVTGNHDMNYDVKADSLADESFEKEFGPATYSFNQGKVHFIILDDILYPDPRDGKGYWGGFTSKQLTFLKNDLQWVPKDHLVVLSFHIPITEEEGDDSFRDEDRIQLFQLLKDFPHTLSLSAHTHFQYQDFFSADRGWLQKQPHHHFNVGATCGDWYSGILDEKGIPISDMRDGTPKGYVFMTFRGNQYSARYKAAGKPDDFQFRIFAPRVVKQNASTSAKIYANFFMGRSADSVFYRIDDNGWLPMKYTHDYDPSFLHLLHEWDFAETLPEGRRPSNPERCFHLWRGDIRVNLPAGEHIIEVKVTDMFGQTFSQKASYRIAAPN
ncbi:MAG TPA: calcineurin-like phosphoesterase family protein [Bacteroidales bacterium]|nr:calcineurin-like phosphoesterase family protein [Bacteroidales bacterium]